MSLVAAIIVVTSASLDCTALPVETTTTNASLTTMRRAWERVLAVASDLHGATVTLRVVEGAASPSFCADLNVVVVGLDWVTQLGASQPPAVTDALLMFAAGHELGHAIEASTAGSDFSELRADARGLYFSLRAGQSADELGETVSDFLREMHGGSPEANRERSQAVQDLMTSQWVRLDERTRAALILAMVGESSTALALVDEAEEVTAAKGIRIPELNAVRLSIHLLELGKAAPRRCVPLTPTEGLVLRGPMRDPQLAVDKQALKAARTALTRARTEGGLMPWLLDATEGCIEFYAGNRKLAAAKLQSALKTAPTGISARLNENLAVVQSSSQPRKRSSSRGGAEQVPASCPWGGSKTLTDRSFTVCSSGSSLWFRVKTASGTVYTGLRRPLDAVDTAGCLAIGYGSAGQSVFQCGTRIVVEAPDALEVAWTSRVDVASDTRREKKGIAKRLK